jgi:hypothetical protein
MVEELEIIVLKQFSQFNTPISYKRDFIDFFEPGLFYKNVASLLIPFYNSPIHLLP